jgi:hypothetical protein
MVGVALGNGDGTFQPAVAYSTGGFDALSVAVADVNGDGHPDLLVANLCSDLTSGECGPFGEGSVAVLLGNGDGTFQAAVSYSSGGDNANGVVVGHVAVGDVNGDGKPDLIVVNSSVTSCGGESGVGVLLGNGNGTFQAAVNYCSGSSSNFVAAADVNGDGKLDLLVLNSCASVSCEAVGVLLGNGNGTFQPVVTYSSGGYYSTSLAVADVNGDGKPDLVVTNDCAAVSDGFCNSPSGSVGVLLGNGNGTFQTAVTYSSGAFQAQSIAVADMNGDGKPDLLVANFISSTPFRNGNSGVVSLLLGNGDGTFQTAVPHGDGGSDAVSIAAGDFNGDGKPDIVAANSGDNKNFSGNSTISVSLNFSQPGVSFSPSPLNFGNQTVAVSFARSLFVTSAGGRPLHITSVGLSNTSSSDFAVSNECPASLDMDTHCVILVTFTPSATVTRSATIVVTDDAAGSPQQISVTGTGVLPAVTFEPASLTFPIQVVDLASSSQTVTMTNTGLGELLITNLAVSGPFIEGTNCPKSMAPGKQCTIAVTFEPTTFGALTGSISLTDNAPGSPQSITLSGTATALQLGPRSASFGIQPVGTTSTSVTFQLASKSNSTITITGVNLTGANPGDFVQTNNCGGSVAPGASCYIKVQFAPTATGTRTATLSVSDNAGGSPLVSLTGKGI